MRILNDDAARLYKNDRMPPPNIKFKHKLTRTLAVNSGIYHYARILCSVQFAIEKSFR